MLSAESDAFGTGPNVDAAVCRRRVRGVGEFGCSNYRIALIAG